MNFRIFSRFKDNKTFHLQQKQKRALPVLTSVLETLDFNHSILPYAFVTCLFKLRIEILIAFCRYIDCSEMIESNQYIIR